MTAGLGVELRWDPSRVFPILRTGPVEVLIPATERLAAGAPAAGRVRTDVLERGICALALALGVCLRVFRFWGPSLWLDEMGTAHVAAARGWATLVERCRFDCNPPVSHLVARIFLLFGHTEFFLRLPSVLFGLASLVLLMRILSRWIGARAAWYGGALLALNSRGILHSQEARMYSLAIFLALASLYLCLRVIEDAGWPYLAGYAAATLLLGYTHLIFNAVLAGQIAVALGFRLWSSGRPGNLDRLLATQGLLLALLAPLAPLARSVGGASRAYYAWIERPDAAWFAGLLEWPEISLAVVLAPGLLLLWRKRAQLQNRTAAERFLLWLAAAYLAIFPAAVAAARLGVLNILQPRYLLLPLLGAFVLLAAAAGKGSEPALRVGLCVYLGLGAYFQIAVARQFGPWVGIFPNQDWRAANEWVETHYRPGDVVLLRAGLTPVKVLRPDEPGVQDFLSFPLKGFYNRRPLTVFNLPWDAADLGSSPYTPPAVLNQARQAGQVFVLVNPQRDPWEWGSLERWLGSPGHPVSPVEKRRFLGLELRVYRL